MKRLSTAEFRAALDALYPEPKGFGAEPERLARGIELTDSAGTFGAASLAASQWMHDRGVHFLSARADGLRYLVPDPLDDREQICLRDKILYPESKPDANHCSMGSHAKIPTRSRLLDP